MNETTPLQDTNLVLTIKKSLGHTGEWQTTQTNSDKLTHNNKTCKQRKKMNTACLYTIQNYSKFGIERVDVTM